MRRRIPSSARLLGADSARVALAGAKLVGPLHQGEFDGLCGLYTILNALRLVLARTTPLSYDQCETLFKAGIDFLAAEDRLTLAVRWGIAQTLWYRLVAHLVDRASQLANLTVLALRPFERHPAAQIDAVLMTVEAALEQQRPVLCLLRGPYSHFTVFAGSTPTRLLLHDSYGFRWLNKASCAVGNGGRGRHRLVPATITTLELCGPINKELL